MNNIQCKLKRKYRSPQDSIYLHRFFEDLSTGYSYTLGEKNENKDFFSYEPYDCKIARLIKENRHSYNSYRLEQIIDRIAYSLLAYGKAYLFINPECSLIEGNTFETGDITSIEIREIKGIITRRSNKLLLYSRNFDNSINSIIMSPDQLVTFDIKELGYSRRYFRNLMKKLAKLDMVSNATEMIEENVEAYDFKMHSKNNLRKELKVTKGIGWSFRTDVLSDGYILYKKIQEDKFRISFLDYIVSKINEGLTGILGDDAGEIVAHIKRKNYNQLWSDYSEGRLTGTELTNALFRE